MKIIVTIHPVMNLDGWIIWMIGRWTRQVSYHYLHVALHIENPQTGKLLSYDLRDRGVEYMPINVDPTESVTLDLTPRQIGSVLDRIKLYELMGHKVTPRSLLMAWLFPNSIHYGLCTSFVQFALFGEVTPIATNTHLFMEVLELENLYQTT